MDQDGGQGPSDPCLEKRKPTHPAQPPKISRNMLAYSSATLFAILSALALRSQVASANNGGIPSQAQVISPKSFAVLDYVLPPPQWNATYVSLSACFGSTRWSAVNTC